MKFGIIHGDSNRILEEAERTAYNQHPNTLVLYPKFYPDDMYAVLSPYNLDLDICNQLDAVLYYSGVPDAEFIKVIDKITCKRIVVLGTDYRCLVRATMEELLLTKHILDSADFVLGHDEMFPSVIKLFTNTKPIMMKVPLPIDYALGCSAEENDEKGYDIIIPYGPFETQYIARNCYISALTAQKIIDTSDSFNNMAIFNMTAKEIDLEPTANTLRTLGCRDFTLFPLIPYKRFIQILSKSKFGLNLDMNTGGGKFACDCAMLKKKSVQSEFLPYARYIYHDIPNVLVYPLDVATVLRYSLFGYEFHYAERAYSRVMDFSIRKAAAILEEAVLGDTRRI